MRGWLLRGRKRFRPAILRIHALYDGRVNSEYRIRTATSADLDALDAIERACFPPAEAATREAIQARLAHYPDHFWVLEITQDSRTEESPEGSNSTDVSDSPESSGNTAESPNDLTNTATSHRIASFVNGMVSDEPHLLDAMYDDASMHNPHGAWQMIFGVDTLPAYRTRGYAGAVLQHAIDTARAEGRRGVVLTCKDRLVHYYAKFGFADEGISGSTHGNVTWHEMRLTF